MTGYGETNSVDEFILEHGEDSLEGVIEHHGIKGMRWGVRRTREELDALAGRVRTKRLRKASKTEAAKRKQREEAERKEEEKTTKREPGYREPTKEEKANLETLRDINNYNQELIRALRLDKEFKQLTASEKKTTLDEINAFLATPVGAQSLKLAKQGTPALIKLGKEAYKKADKKYVK